MASGKLTADRDLRVKRHGMFAATVSMHFSEKTKDGNTPETDVRYTGIWEKRGANWLLVHEHLSAPMSN
jgi:ketosteroid isomerase-like protein